MLHPQVVNVLSAGDASHLPQSTAAVVSGCTHSGLVKLSLHIHAVSNVDDGQHVLRSVVNPLLQAAARRMSALRLSAWW
jgi:hypothetical protein